MVREGGVVYITSVIRLLTELLMLNLLCRRMLAVVWGCALLCRPWRRPTSGLRGWGVASISASGGVQDGGHDSWNIASCEYPFFVVLSGTLASVGGLFARRTSSLFPGGGHGLCSSGALSSTSSPSSSSLGVAGTVCAHDYLTPKVCLVDGVLFT